MMAEKSAETLLFVRIKGLIPAWHFVVTFFIFPVIFVSACCSCVSMALQFC